MTRDLNLGGFRLPIEAVTQTFGILGQRGAGKSNTGVVMAEEMYRVQLPWVAIDPKGDWWGVRSGSHALSVPILGGEHGDVPIGAGSGPLVADLIFDENLTTVIDVSDFSLSERHLFLVGFAEQLYRRHKKAPTARHVFLEEAHEYIPQQVTRDKARVKEAMARIPLMGRSWGLGSTTMSQRSARLHKDVLTQIDTLLVHRTTGPQDRDAIEKWVAEHAQAREMMKSLPELADGEVWVWSPHFLGWLDRRQVRRRRTFDSGSTPVAATKRMAATMADIDVPALTKQLAAEVTKREQTDPAALRRRIAELEREKLQIREVRVEVPGPPEPVPVFTDGDRTLLYDLTTQLSELAETHERFVKRFVLTQDAPVQAAVVERPRPAVASQPPATLPTQARGVTPPSREPRPNSGVPARVGLKRAERRILQALRPYGTRTKRQVAVITGYAITGGGFNNALSALRSADLMRGTDQLVITESGIAALGSDWQPLPQGRELLDHWKGQLPRAAAAALERIAAAYPGDVSKEQVAADTGYEVTGGGFNNALSRLRTLELITGSAMLQAADSLFD